MRAMSSKSFGHSKTFLRLYANNLYLPLYLIQPFLNSKFGAVSYAGDAERCISLATAYIGGCLPLATCMLRQKPFSQKLTLISEARRYFLPLLPYCIYYVKGSRTYYRCTEARTYYIQFTLHDPLSRLKVLRTNVYMSLLQQKP